MQSAVFDAELDLEKELAFEAADHEALLKVGMGGCGWVGKLSL